MNTTVGKTDSPAVCILTAGLGTRMGGIAQDLNKALLPIRGKAVISHIIESFSADTEFVIGLGYKGDLVRDYLTIAHPDAHFIFVEIDNFDGPGSGPGYSLSKCQEHLKRPFFYLPCDGLFDIDLNVALDHDWVGVAVVPQEESSKYCMFDIDDSGLVTTIRDKELCPPDYMAFTGLVFVKNYDAFWRGLSEPTLIGGERQVSKGLEGLVKENYLSSHSFGWRDLGSYEKYIA